MAGTAGSDVIIRGAGVAGPTLVFRFAQFQHPELPALESRSLAPLFFTDLKYGGSQTNPRRNKRRLLLVRVAAS